MHPLPASSGDPLADRRHAYAEALAEGGDAAAAAEVMEQALERAPGWAAGWWRLAVFLEDAGRKPEAEAALRRSLALAPDDPFGAGLALARLDGGPAAVPPAPSTAYVATLFDAYASRFDAALLGPLGYRAPALLAEALGLSAARIPRALDLGCGTGLMGALLRPAADWLESVDLSEGMLREAAAKGVYDRLIAAEMTEFLARPGEAYDLITAADVFAYLGDLSPVLRAAHARLAPDGQLAFTVEALHGDDGWRLGADTLRFAHSEAYLRRAAAEAGFAVAQFGRATLRREKGAEVSGFVVVLRR